MHFLAGDTFLESLQSLASLFTSPSSLDPDPVVRTLAIKLKAHQDNLPI